MNLNAPETRQLADLDAERALLGAVLLTSDTLDVTSEVLSSADFYDPRHSTIYAAMVAAWSQDQPTDPVVLARALDEAGDLQRVGGVPYLHSLVADVPTAANAGHYARIVADWAARRRVLESAIRAARLAQDLGMDVSAVVDEAQKSIHDATAGRRATGGLLKLSDYIDDDLEHLQAVADGRVPRGLSSGIGSLDKLLGGFQPGQLVIPAARPGGGKSVAALGFAKACARRGRPALVYPMEMSKREVNWRILSDLAEVNLDAFTRGNLTSYEWGKVKQARKTLGSWPLYVDDTCHNVTEMRAAARRFKQRHGDIGLIVVDYIQRLRGTVKAERRDLEVGRFANELKTLARELGCTVIAPCQLNRGNEARQDKRPQLSDLRDSGELEQEADIVILIHREDYYDKETERAGEADFIVAKHRNGPTDTIAVAAQLHHSRFVDFDTPDDPEAF